MKEIKLISLHLENFMRFRDFTFEPKGDNATIRGPNKAGKTTQASAFSYLLFDKDLAGNSPGNFSLKTRLDGQILPNVDHTVTGILEVDGVPLTLQKIYKEKWLKKRKVLTGHTTEYSIDEVPVLKKAYMAKIEEIIPETTFKLLTSVTHFANMKWEDRRKILFQICEGLTEEGLEDAEKQKKILASQRVKINEKKDQIQPRIDEKNRELAAIAELNQPEIQARIDSLEKQIQDIKSDSTVAVMQKEQAELETKLSQIEAGQEKKKQEASVGIIEKMNQLKDARADKNRICYGLDIEVDAQSGIIESAEKGIQCLYSEWDHLIAENPDILDLCPTCQKPFTPDEKEAVVAEFNLQQSEKKEGINEQGKESKNRKKGAEITKTKLEADLKTERAVLAEIEGTLKEMKAELENILSPPDMQKEDIEIGGINQRIREIEIVLRQEDRKYDTKTIESDLKIERAKIAIIDAGSVHTARIKELGIEEKTLAAQIEELESRLFKAEERIKKEAEIVEDKVNEMFDGVQFSLFDIKLNDSIVPCCKILLENNEWGHGTSTGQEIIAGIEMVRVLQEHNQMRCPIFLDRAEALTIPLPEMSCQIIKLKADEDCEKLSITDE